MLGMEVTSGLFERRVIVCLVEERVVSMREGGKEMRVLYDDWAFFLNNWTKRDRVLKVAISS